MLKDRRFQLLFRIVVIIIFFMLMSIPTIFMSVTCTRTRLSCVYVTQWSCMFSAELLAPCMRSCFGCQNMMHIPCLGVTCSMLADCCMSTHHATCCIKLDLHRCGFEMVPKTWSRISAGLYMLLPAAHALLCFAYICLHTTACTQLLAHNCLHTTACIVLYLMLRQQDASLCDHQRQNRKEKITPFGANSMRNQELYRAAQ